MTNRIDVTVYCSARRGKHRFTSTFEEQQPGEWHCIQNIPVEPVPLMKRIASIFEGNGTTAKHSSLDRVNGELSYDMPCPFCKNSCLVHCCNCGSLSCHPSATGDFYCPVCRDHGTIDQELHDLSGKASKYQGRRKQS